MDFRKPPSTISFVVGSAVLFLLLATSLFQTKIITNIITKSSVSYQRGSLNVIERLPPGTARSGEYEISEEQHSVLNIKYPAVMRENETAVVSVSVNAFRDMVMYDKITGAERERKRLKKIFAIDERGSLTLSSSGFNLAPHMTITKAKGTLLPVGYFWTITPERNGRHMLILDFSDFNAPAQQPDQEIKLSINNLPGKVSSHSMLRLEVFVNTIWGVSRVIFEVVRGGIALIAFLLMYPMVTDWLRDRKYRTASNTDSIQ